MPIMGLRSGRATWFRIQKACRRQRITCARIQKVWRRRHATRVWIQNACANVVQRARGLGDVPQTSCNIRLYLEDMSPPSGNMHPDSESKEVVQRWSGFRRGAADVIQSAWEFRTRAGNVVQRTRGFRRHPADVVSPCHHRRAMCIRFRIHPAEAAQG